jgi:hypothetical protein
MKENTIGVIPGGTRVGVQKFGRFLSGMVLPNIGAFIAWGLITALFIPTGWPSEARRAHDHVPAPPSDRLHRR